MVVALVGGLLSLVGLTSASAALTSAYAGSLDALFAPSALPTVIPRLIVLGLLVAIGALAAGLALDGWRAPARRRVKHGAIWRLLGPPFSNALLLDRATAELWNLIRGAAAIAPPARQDLGRRYIELLAENLGQPGFRELLIVRMTWTPAATSCSRSSATGRQRFFGQGAGTSGSRDAPPRHSISPASGAST